MANPIATVIPGTTDPVTGLVKKKAKVILNPVQSPPGKSNRGHKSSRAFRGKP